ncbi:MAG TPA: hypothetical protein VI341_04845 [Actinomycetota bacterium]
MKRFEFRFDPRYRRILWLLGITPSRSWVVIDRGWLDARFGLWRLRTPLVNIECTEVSGPYVAHRAIGPHVSMVDRGLSFGSNIERGVCLRFHEPVTTPTTLSVIHHPGLTVTVDDIDALVAAIGRGLDAAGDDRSVERD